MLSAENLSCVRGERALFAELDLTVDAGEWLHVRGENGAGKTSLLRLLVGLSQPAAGGIFWCAQPIRQIAAKYRKNLLYLGHHGAVKEDLTALENLELSAALNATPLSKQEAISALHRFGLKGREDLPVCFLSAGQKRRVLLAELITRKAALWVLDEPFNALDVNAADTLATLTSEHLAAGGMAILTSHQALPIPNGKVLQL